MKTYQSEPWLDPRYTNLFHTKKERDEALELLSMAPFCPSASIKVYTESGHFLREELMGGAMSFLSDDTICVEGNVDQPRDRKEWAQSVGTFTKGLRKWLDTEYRLAPGNPGRYSLANTTKGVKAKIFMIFVKGDRFNPYRKDENWGKYVLLQHLKPDVSREILSNAVIVCGKDIEENHYHLWDSAYILFSDATYPWNMLKIYGTEDIEHLAEKCGAGHPDPIFKGMALVCPTRFRAQVLTAAGLDPNAHKDADLLACNRKYVKFFRNERTEGVKVWLVMPTIMGKTAVLTSEERQLDAMLPGVVDDLSQKRLDEARRIAGVFEEYSKGDPEPLISLTAKVINDLAGLTSEDVEALTQEEREDMDALFNSVGRVRTALVTGLPLPASEVISLIQPMIIARIKGIRMKGITKFSFPSSIVSKFGCALSKSDCKRLDIDVGDKVTDIRYPNVGSSMITLTIEHQHSIDAVMAHPETGAKYQAEDYDGDISIVLPVPMVDNNKVIPFAGKNVDSSVIPTLVEVFLNSTFGKLNIGITDSSIDRITGNFGFDHMLKPIYETLQVLIDMAKKNVTNLIDLPGVLKKAGVPPVPAGLRLMKGRLEASVNGISRRRTISLSYPAMIQLIRDTEEITPLDDLFREAIKALPLVVAERDSQYVSLVFTKGTTAKRLLKSYEEARKAVGLEIFDPKYGEGDERKAYRRKFYERRDFDEDFAASIEDLAIEEMAKILKSDPKAARAAYKVHAKYQQHVDDLKAFKPNAYKHLRELRSQILEAEPKSGLSMKYLFWALVSRNSSKAYKYSCQTANTMGCMPIHVKSTNILASLPVIVGEYNLKTMIELSGYTREPGIKVI